MKNKDHFRKLNHFVMYIILFSLTFFDSPLMAQRIDCTGGVHKCENKCRNDQSCSTSKCHRDCENYCNICTN